MCFVAGAIFDSEDKLISKTVGTDTIFYAIDPSESLSKVLVKTINGVSTYYVYGLGLISEETNADYKLYHFDYRGSTILLTDGTGQITDTYNYGPFETLFDVVSVAFSAYDFFSDPTGAKLATLAWDTAAAFLPFIPGSYVKKGVSIADDAFDLAKGGIDGASKGKWYKATFDSVEDSIEYHLSKHGKGRTLEEYTDDAIDFYNKNKKLGTEITLKDGTKGIKIQTGTGKNKVGGYWTNDGKLVTFWD